MGVATDRHPQGFTRGPVDDDEGPCRQLAGGLLSSTPTDGDHRGVLAEDYSFLRPPVGLAGGVLGIGVEVEVLGFRA